MTAAGTHAAELRDQPVSHVLTWPVHSDAQLPSLCWFCFREVLGVDALWPILMAANALPALVQLFTLPFFPDSPRYLLIDKKDKEGCIKGKETGRKVFILAKSGKCSKAPQKPGRDVHLGKRLLAFWL